MMLFLIFLTVVIVSIWAYNKYNKYSTLPPNVINDSNDTNDTNDTDFGQAGTVTYPQSLLPDASIQDEIIPIMMRSKMFPEKTQFRFEDINIQKNGTKLSARFFADVPHPEAWTSVIPDLFEIEAQIDNNNNLKLTKFRKLVQPPMRGHWVPEVSDYMTHPFGFRDTCNNNTETAGKDSWKLANVLVQSNLPILRTRQQLDKQVEFNPF